MTCLTKELAGEQSLLRALLQSEWVLCNFGNGTRRFVSCIYSMLIFEMPSGCFCRCTRDGVGLVLFPLAATLHLLSPIALMDMPDIGLGVLLTPLTPRCPQGRSYPRDGFPHPALPKAGLEVIPSMDNKDLDCVCRSIHVHESSSLSFKKVAT